MSEAASTSVGFATIRGSQETTREQIDRRLETLTAAKSRYKQLSLGERIALVEACLEGTFRLAAEWNAAAGRAKGLA